MKRSWGVGFFWVVRLRIWGCRFKIKGQGPRHCFFEAGFGLEGFRPQLSGLEAQLRGLQLRLTGGRNGYF